MYHKKKPKYEKPSLIAFDLSTVVSQPSCNPFGSAPSGNHCMNGFLAFSGKCQYGTGALGSQCNPGYGAAGHCLDGLWPSGNCNAGGNRN